MVYFTNNIILFGIRKTINAYGIYNKNLDLFNEFVRNHNFKADVKKSASIKLILLATYSEPFMYPIDKIKNWEIYLKELEDGTNQNVRFIQYWETLFRQEYEATHFVPLSMPVAFHSKDMVFSLIFYWFFHKLWLDQRVIENAWDSISGLSDFFHLDFYTSNPHVKRLKRWVLTDGLITVITESLLYISTTSIILYLIFVLVPRLVNKRAVGSPILILIFHLCVLILSL
jgi:hypothetical protein